MHIRLQCNTIIIQQTTCKLRHSLVTVLRVVNVRHQAGFGAGETSTVGIKGHQAHGVTGKRRLVVWAYAVSLSTRQDFRCRKVLHTDSGVKG